MVFPEESWFKRSKDTSAANSLKVKNFTFL